MLNGVDISGHDEGIDTSTLTADFVIVKATEGLQGTIYNPSYRTMADRAAASGKLIGFYHYANGKDPRAEAESFWNAVRDYKGKALLALDWEGQGNKLFGSGQDVGWCMAFMDRLAELSDSIPILYTSKGVCNQYDWSAVARKYPLWGAEYAYNIGEHTYWGYETNPWQSSQPWGAWGPNADIFQYGGVRPLPSNGGAPNPLDADQMLGDVGTWRCWCEGRKLKTINPAEEAAEIHAFMCDDPRFGYSQSPRWGGDYNHGEVATFVSKAGYEYKIPCGSYDCSSSTITAWKLALSRTRYAGVLDTATYTADMRVPFVSSGLFTAKYSPAHRGDLYLAEGKHVAMCQDGGSDGVYGYDCLSEFNRNENHAATGGQAGDQDGGESVIRGYYDDGWNTILHYFGGLLEDITATEDDEDEEGEASMMLIEVREYNAIYLWDGSPDTVPYHLNGEEKKAVEDVYKSFHSGLSIPYRRVGQATFDQILHMTKARKAWLEKGISEALRATERGA